MIPCAPKWSMSQKQAELGKDQKSYLLRMPIDLANRIEKEAKKTGQSINKLIVDALKKLFK